MDQLKKIRELMEDRGIEQELTPRVGGILGDGIWYLNNEPLVVEWKTHEYIGLDTFDLIYSLWCARAHVPILEEAGIVKFSEVQEESK